MNYLAHAYLSFNDPAVLTGNLISDFVKGKKKYDFDRRILKGIELHRDIDTFTDDHPVNREAAKIFRSVYGLYGRAFLDVAYDHFLAVRLAAEGPEKFEAYTEKIYDDLASFHEVLPPDFQSIFPYMRRHNWLYNYQFAFGMQNSFKGLAHRALYIEEGHTAYQLFENNYETLKQAFEEFFPDLENFSLEKFSDIH